MIIHTHLTNEIDYLSEIEQKFDLNKLTSLAVYDVLSLLGVSSRIKWPNDIIVDNKKIAGILIHNIISNKMITSSIIGIGLNVNQEEFKKYIIPATSLLLQLGKQYDINYIRLTLLSCLYKRIDNYRKQIVIDRDYNDFLYEKNKKCSFLRNNQIQNGIIKSVDEHGCLIIQIGNKLCAFNENEIKCIFNI